MRAWPILYCHAHLPPERDLVDANGGAAVTDGIKRPAVPTHIRRGMSGTEAELRRYLEAIRVRVQLIGHARNNMYVNISHAWL